MASIVRIRLLPPLPDLGGSLPPAAWTLVGASAIPLWATWPTLATFASGMPLFQFLGVIFAVGWATLAALDRRSPSPPAERRAAIAPAVACAVGFLGADVLYILATRHIPPAQANLIAFSWPVMLALFGAALGLFRLLPRHLAALVLGFAGAAVVIGADDVVFSWAGIALAAASGAAWALFCIYRMRHPAAAGNVLANGCAISAGACLVLHLTFERWVTPSPPELAAMVFLGVAPQALANLAWDNGIRRGDGRILANMAYGTPLASALLLVATGYAMATWNLAVGAVLIVAAGMLASATRRP